jgi:hypothetical protein
MINTQQPIKFNLAQAVRVHNTPKIAPMPHTGPLTIDDINAEIAGMGIEFIPHKETRDPLLDSFLESKSETPGNQTVQTPESSTYTM